MVPLFEFWPVQSGKVIGLLLLIVIFTLTIWLMRGKGKLFVRRVAGLDAIDESLGRATEMGKPVAFTYGQASGMFDYWTVAALSILAHVSHICAASDTRLIIPTGGSQGSYIVRPVAVDIVRTAYEAEGKSEKFDEKDIPFLSGEQFAWGTGFAGILLSERPASTIITGASGADVMMHAEISNQIGALTITSGSYIANVAVMACASDYIMIGEEVPAAGAYLSQERAQLASIRTQDVYKFIAVGLLILGWILVQAGNTIVTQILTT
jgi:hypothetical protein